MFLICHCAAHTCASSNRTFEVLKFELAERTIVTRFSL